MQNGAPAIAGGDPHVLDNRRIEFQMYIYARNRIYQNNSRCAPPRQLINTVESEPFSAPSKRKKKNKRKKRQREREKTRKKDGKKTGIHTRARV